MIVEWLIVDDYRALEAEKDLCRHGACKGRPAQVIEMPPEWLRLHPPPAAEPAKQV